MMIDPETNQMFTNKGRRMQVYWHVHDTEWCMAITRALPVFGLTPCRNHCVCMNNIERQNIGDQTVFTDRQVTLEEAVLQQFH